MRPEDFLEIVKGDQNPSPIFRLASIPAKYPNFALGATVMTSGVSQGTNPISVITDGNTDTAAYFGADVGLIHVTVDLGAVYPIDTIKVWHYYSDGRTYNGTKTEVSADGVNWTTVFDSAVSGTYAETSSGKTHTFATKQVRYVRDWLNGSSSNSYNHWVEIQALSNKSVLQFDGETMVSGRTYPRLSSYTPTAGDRVLVAMVGHGGVILGKVL